MKIAAISDIHGNMDALSAVMDDIAKHECSKIVVLGDYAMAGPQPKDAVEFFMQQKDNPMYDMIQGNTDLMISDYNDDIEKLMSENAPIMLSALKDDLKILNSSHTNFLRQLPIQKEIVCDGIKILLVHGSPRKNNEDILPTATLEQVENMVKSTDADIILCGHTHIPCGFQTSKKQTVVNVGSVGRPFTPQPKSCYLIIEINDGKYSFEHQFVEYDKECAYIKLKNRNFEGADKLAETLINPEKRHF